MRRVAITGAGTVNALAQDVPGTLAALREGRSAIGPLVLRDADRLAIRIGAQVRGWAPEARFDRALVGMSDRVTLLALQAAQEAVAQSGLTFDEPLGAMSGVVMGTAGGGLSTSDDAYRAVYQDGRNRVHPFTVPRLMANAAASRIAMAFGLTGPGLTVSTACAASNHAMGLAFQMVRAGTATVMLAGGAEAMLCFGGLKAWEGLRVMSPTGCRPFCRTRDGMVMGEGAGVLVFEEMDHARARGAPILAEVAGFGMTTDAADMVAPGGDGAARAIAAALRDARLDPADVGYINAHGTGTAANDRSECAAVARVFGPAADRVMISATKAMHGHCIGATGAVELLACLMALGEGVIAPTVNHAEPDPDCPLDVVPNIARAARVDAVLSNAFAFGGLNAVIALRRV